MKLFGNKGPFGAVMVLWLTFVPGLAEAASFFGLQPGDQIDAVTYDSPLNGVSYTLSNGILHFSGFATAITTIGGDVYTEINGGMFIVDMNFVSETLTSNGDGTYDYAATLSGPAGLLDLRLFAPDCTLPGCGPSNDPEGNGFDPEQDGRLLMTGDFTTPIMLQSTIDPNATGQTFTLSGFFAVTGGDAQFTQAYGSIGSISFVGGGVDSFVPPLTGTGGNLNPPADSQVFDQDWIAHAKGAMLPQASAPFSPIPEPSSFALLALGMGWFARKIRRRN